MTSDLGYRRRLPILGTCCLSILIFQIDATLLNVALPAIQRDLHASVAGLQWTVDAYILVLACFLMLAGSVADRFGRRRAFQTGLAVFRPGVGTMWPGPEPRVADRVPHDPGARRHADGPGLRCRSSRRRSSTPSNARGPSEPGVP